MGQRPAENLNRLYLAYTLKAFSCPWWRGERPSKEIDHNPEIFWEQWAFPGPAARDAAPGPVGTRVRRREWRDSASWDRQHVQRAFSGMDRRPQPESRSQAVAAGGPAAPLAGVMALNYLSPSGSDLQSREGSEEIPKSGRWEITPIFT